MSILSADEDKQEEVLKHIDKMADGTIGHIASTILTKDVLEELKSDFQKAKEKAKNSRKRADVSKAIFAAAAIRDGVYSTRGRKFMRTAGLNGKARAAWGRMQGLNWMSEE